MTDKEREFTDIIREHRTTIYSVCFMFAKSSDEANDLFQEALVKLWLGFDGFEHRSNIATWIWRITLNCCITLEHKKRRSSSLKLDISRDIYTAEDGDSRQMQMLHKRIHRLQPFDRAIVMLWLENISYEEIAAIVGISIKNVSVRLYRIKEQLKNMSNE